MRFEKKHRDLIFYGSIAFGLVYGLAHAVIVGGGEFLVNGAAGIVTGALMGLSFVVLVTGLEYITEGTVQQ